MDNSVFYNTLSMGQLEILFRSSLKRRGWVYHFHDFEFTDLCFYNPRTKEEIRIDLFLGKNVSDRRSFYLKYLNLITVEKEEDAHQHLETTMLSKPSVGKAYEIFTRLAKISVTKISQRVMNESDT